MLENIMALVDYLLRTATTNVAVWGAVLLLCATIRHIAKL